MRAVIDARYLRGKPSGIGAYVHALATRVPRRAPSDRFHLWAHPKAPCPITDAPNVTQETLRVEPNAVATLLFGGQLASFEGVEVFHGPHNLLGFGIKCATVVTVHDVMWLEEPELIDPVWPRRVVRELFFGAGIRNALKNATRLLTVSKASADAMMRIAPDTRGRIDVTYNAADPYFRPAADRDAARARAAQLLGTDAPYFLVVGQNQPSKGHELAIEAFAAVRRPSERLVLVQRSNPKSRLDRRVRELGVVDRVIFSEALPPDGLVTLMQAATCLLQPSFAEGFGMPVVEAMAAGCPVIASDIAPLREIVANAGEHSKLRDFRSLGESMRRLADDEIYRDELRHRGLERARDFDWDETAEIALGAYRAAYEQGPKRL